jgi:hypothetical protein
MPRASEKSAQKGTSHWSRTILVAARVLISVVGIAYFLAYEQKLDFVWFNRSLTQGTALCWSLMGILALRALGLGNWIFDRALSVLNLVLAQALFSKTFPYSNVNEGMYLMLAFWCCFIQLNPPRGASIPGWARFCSVLTWPYRFTVAVSPNSQTQFGKRAPVSINLWDSLGSAIPRQIGF